MERSTVQSCLAAPFSVTKSVLFVFYLHVAGPIAAHAYLAFQRKLPPGCSSVGIAKKVAPISVGAGSNEIPDAIRQGTEYLATKRLRDHVLIQGDRFLPT